jgi:hypothetical protein
MTTKSMRNTLRNQRGFRGQNGQSLLEAVVAIPLVLAIAFNAINFGYFWFVVLALSAAPRMGVQYASQGGFAVTTGAPSAAAVSNEVYANVTGAIYNATTSNTAVQVCSTSNRVTNNITNCTTYGPSFSFGSPAMDPEAPVFYLNRVGVEYAVSPIIPGGAFSVVVPSNLKFNRQVSMRSLY